MSEDEKNLTAYCGLYCGDCFGFKGTIADMARDLRKELRSAKFSRFADFVSNYSFGAVYKNYPQCYEVLGAMVKFRCNKGCRDGGGPPFCKIRQCCQKKEIEGCWECEEFETCEKLDFLKPVHEDAHIKNLRKIKKQGMEKFVEGKRDW
ncbi:DUF3795 domain-containing protein [bacterium]|nr:DUF3795 domain-containing protein [FCB group bacterium]MBL7191582.1 DUF3795 domain-containing protein [bacterium]